MLRLQRAGVLDSTAAPDARTLRAKLQFVADELSRRQRRDGAIGYWSRGGWTTPWLTTYAGLLLADARSMGTEVGPRVFEGIARFVQSDTGAPPWVRDSVYGTREDRSRLAAWRLSAELAQLHYLRRIGRADPAREHRLLEAEGAMLWEDRVWLAELLATGDDRAAAHAQLARVWRNVELAGTRVDVPDSLLRTFGFPSHVRPVARLLEATMMIEPDHPRLARLIERVVQHGRARGERTWNTQDFAAAARALARVAVWQRTSEPTGAVVVRSAHPRGAGRVLLSGMPGRGGDATTTLDGLLERDGEWMVVPLHLETGGGPVFYTLTVDEVPLRPPTTPDAQGIVVERWFERFDDGRPTTEVTEGELVRGRLRITVPSDREFVAVEDLLPAGLEVVDLSLRTSRSLGPFESERSEAAERAGDRANPDESSTPWVYGSWDGGWWSPWEHKEIRDDRVLYFARVLWKGTYTASYVARATTAGRFVRPPAHAEEMYNPSLGGRSEGGAFTVRVK
jgi:uncharacterized protein YfaS (alpha-2-macroglobulin family)